MIVGRQMVHMAWMAFPRLGSLDESLKQDLVISVAENLHWFEEIFVSKAQEPCVVVFGE